MTNLTVVKAMQFKNSARKLDNKEMAAAHAEACAELLSRNGYNPINFGSANDGAGFVVLIENPDFTPDVIDG